MKSQFSTRLFLALLFILLVAFLETQCLDTAGSEERRVLVKEMEEQTDQEREGFMSIMTGKNEIAENLIRNKNSLERKRNQGDAVGGRDKRKTGDDGDSLSDTVVKGKKKKNRVIKKNRKQTDGLKNLVEGKNHGKVKKIKDKKVKGKPLKIKKKKIPVDNEDGKDKKTRNNAAKKGKKGGKGNKGKGNKQKGNETTNSSEKSSKSITTSKKHPTFSFSNYLLADCGKTYNLVRGTSYLFTSDGGQQSRNCRSTFLSSPGTSIKFFCPVFNLHLKKCKKESLLLTENKSVKWPFCKTDVVNIETIGTSLQVLHKRRRLAKKKCPGAFLCEISVRSKHGIVTVKPPVTTKPKPTHPVPVTDPFPIHTVKPPVTTKPKPTHPIPVTDPFPIHTVPGPIHTITPPTGAKPPPPFQHRPFCRNCTPGNIIVNRIVGGIQAREKEFPFQARIMVHNKILCSGTLISLNLILTAAHCFPQGHEGTLVTLGEYDTKVNEPYSQVIKVRNVIKHENFNKKTMDNDIAILELIEPAVITPYVIPACIATSKDTFPSSLTVTSGWGHDKFGGSVSTVLMKVGLDLISNEECQQMYSSRGYTITSNMICTYTQNKDACQGDSGGPS
ncbi:uncharacterized protein LOC135107481 isoform X2 [Scylla paramamosain]|uniref:uncharacterized protein LOC135107481 isoform X2 n=1 Tax=Scylla paramamosain TaxID=85552 RepID=UPI0030836C17